MQNDTPSSIIQTLLAPQAFKTSLSREPHKKNTTLLHSLATIPFLFGSVVGIGITALGILQWATPDITPLMIGVPSIISLAGGYTILHVLPLLTHAQMEKTGLTLGTMLTKDHVPQLHSPDNPSLSLDPLLHSQDNLLSSPPQHKKAQKNERALKYLHQLHVDSSTQQPSSHSSLRSTHTSQPPSQTISHHAS